MDWERISQAIAEAEKENPTMDIYSDPGTKLLFAYPENGSEYDAEMAAKELIYHGEYTVKEIFVGQSRSDVELEEKPGKEFNTIHFANMEELK